MNTAQIDSFAPPLFFSLSIDFFRKWSGTISCHSSMLLLIWMCPTKLKFMIGRYSKVKYRFFVSIIMECDGKNKSFSAPPVFFPLWMNFRFAVPKWRIERDEINVCKTALSLRGFFPLWNQTIHFKCARQPNLQQIT